MIVSRYLHFLSRFASGLLIGALALLLVSPAMGQPAAFEKAKKAYDVYDYETAIDLFSEVSEDASADMNVRREALLYLGRIYIGQNMQSKARDAMAQLVNTAPPPVDLNPNREPPPLTEMYYRALKDKRGNYSVDKRGGLHTLAVMDFRNSSIFDRERYAPLSKGFPSMIINFLNGATDLKVIERQRIQWLLKELKLQRKGDVVDQSTAVRMGKVLGASTVLFGNYSVIDDDQMRLSGRLVKVETSEILISEKVTGEPDEFSALVRELSQNLTRAINVEMEETDLGTGSETQLLDAQLAYARGLDEMEDGNYRAAQEQFEQALEHDPNYSLAQERLDSLEPMLASAQNDSTEQSSEEGGRRDQ